MSKGKSQKKHTLSWIKIKHNICRYNKVVLRGKLIALNAYIRKEESSKIKIRAYISDTNQEKIEKKINENKELFFLNQ